MGLVCPSLSGGHVSPGRDEPVTESITGFSVKEPDRGGGPARPGRQGNHGWYRLDRFGGGGRAGANRTVILLGSAVISLQCSESGGRKASGALWSENDRLVSGREAIYGLGSGAWFGRLTGCLPRVGDSRWISGPRFRMRRLCYRCAASDEAGGFSLVVC